MIAQLRPSDLQAWLESHAGDARAPVVLDVREAWELQTAGLQPDGFELTAIPMNSVPDRLNELDPDRPIAVLCHHGTRSQRVAMFLEQHGFTDVANIAGGIEAWSVERDPSVPRY